MSAVPFATEAVLGWRLWHVQREGDSYRLASWVRGGAWPARARLEATCSRLLRTDCPAAPARGHTCGIYALRTRELATALLAELPALGRPVALGRVSLWGRVFENTHGWRAQYAYPYELELVGAPRGVAAALRGRYAVDVA